MSKLKIGYLGFAALLVAAGCADERPPRSFVQPNVIKKSDLGGQWNYLQTVTEAPVTNGSAFQGLSSSLMRIRFDIQEHYLYARRAIEHVEGSEDGFWHDPAHYKGQVLAAWHIDSQFDIIRDYNSTTGEQTNKIIESQERPWDQREFIRVDWSMNEVVDFVGIGLDFFFSAGQPMIQPVSYWVSDPNDPDALHIERAQADDQVQGFQKGEANYLDITNQVQLTPDLLTASYQQNGQWYSFTYPKCFFYYEQDDCASQRVKVRHAFAKVGSNHDVEPRPWDGKQMNLFGVWDVGLRRMTYNRNYGIVNSGFRRHAARFNIWQESCKTFTDENGNTVHPQACEPGWYMKDGVWHTTNDDVRIPYKERVLKTIPYYAEGSQPVVLPDGSVEGRYPEFLYPQFQEIVRQWNDAMKVAVKDLLETDPPHDIFVACHNPVDTDHDPQACWDGLQPDINADGSVKMGSNGKPIYHVRQGDPRRSTVFWVNEQQNAGPLGYGPPMFDEETGETFSGQAYIYGAAVDTYAARSRDLMLLQNGDLANDTYTSGSNVLEFVSRNMRGVTDKPQTYAPRQMQAMTRAMDFDWAMAFSPKNGYPALDTSSNNALWQSLARREDAMYTGYFGQLAATDGRATRLGRIIGQPLEKMMIAPENMAVGGVSPARGFDTLTEMEKTWVSPLRYQAMQDTNLKEQIKAETLGVDFATFDDAGLSQRLRLILQDPNYCPNGPDSCSLSAKADALRQDLKKAIFLGVTLHEVGHNMGCRHNFRASYDAMNYFPDYWKIRTDAIQHGDRGMQPNPDGKVHARFVNVPGGAVTQYELDNAVREKQYSSIMDYGAEFNSDLQGLGLYDKALIKFSYAEMVEVFTNVSEDPNVNATQKIGSLHVFQNSYGLPSPLGTGATLSAINYTDYPDLFKDGWQGIYERADVSRNEITLTTLPGQNGDTVMADSLGRPLVPYYFCSDEFAFGMSCARFDAGPDPYEQAQDYISRYQNFYLYNNWKRDRQAFWTSLGYKSRIGSRYFDPLRSHLTWYVLLRSELEDNTRTNCDINGSKNCKTTNQFFADEHGWGAFTLAVANGFDLLGQILTTPTMGLFAKHTSPDGQVYWKQFRDDLFEGQNLGDKIRRVGWIDGKYVDTRWDFDGCGYYWFEECQTRIGYMIDKQVALDVLSESQAYFTGRDTNTDVRQYAIGYIIPFKKQIQEKFASIFAGDTSAIAPIFTAKGNNDYNVVNRSWLFDDPAALPKSDRVDPAMGFTIQLYAGVYGLSAFPTTFDREFIDNTEVFVLGNGEATTTDDQIKASGTTNPAELVANGGNKAWFLVNDSLSGKTYAAHSVAPIQSEVLDPVNGNAGNDYNSKTVGLRVDISVRMLQRLAALRDAVTAANAMSDGDTNKVAAVAAANNEYNLYRQNIEVMRSLHNAFGYSVYKTDAPFYW